MWVDKHKPKSLDEVAGNEHAVSNLKSMVNNKSMINLMFQGRAGVGKTICAELLAKELLGSENLANFSYYDSSSDRGIDTIRDDVKDKASTRPINSDRNIIFLDEADNMTSDAHHSLRRTMEEYDDFTMFILSCNYPYKIITPIKSRCALIRFKPIPRDAMRDRFNTILDRENINMDGKIIEGVLDFSESVVSGNKEGGDMRQGINMLQLCATRFKNGVNPDVIVDGIAEQTDIDDYVDDMVDSARSLELGDVENTINELLYRGINPEDIFRSLSEHIFRDGEMSLSSKEKLMDVCARGSMVYNNGGNPRSQLMNVMTSLASKIRDAKRGDRGRGSVFKSDDESITEEVDNHSIGNRKSKVRTGTLGGSKDNNDEEDDDNGSGSGMASAFG